MVLLIGLSALHYFCLLPNLLLHWLSSDNVTPSGGVHRSSVESKWKQFKLRKDGWAKYIVGRTQDDKKNLFQKKQTENDMEYLNQCHRRPQSVLQLILYDKVYVSLVFRHSTISGTQHHRTAVHLFVYETAERIWIHIWICRFIPSGQYGERSPHVRKPWRLFRNSYVTG